MSSPIFNEMTDAHGISRPHYQAFDNWLKGVSADTVQVKQTEADLIFRRTGITFSLNGDEGGTERLIPSDLIPRIIHGKEWAHLEKGLVQRVKAINMFLHDVYHQQLILKAGLIPAEQVLANAQFMPVMLGLDLPHQIYAHIAGVDIVRHSDGDFYVLEDNLRVPSGVSYMLSNRLLMMRLFPRFIPSLCGASGRALPSVTTANFALGQLGRPAHSGAAHAGAFQQRVFRACVFGQANGHRTGRRLGPFCAPR